MDRMLDGWLNETVSYPEEIQKLGWGMMKEENKTKLLRYLAAKLGHPGDLKLAEHVLCKIFRGHCGWDLFWKEQSFYDIDVTSRGSQKLDSGKSTGRRKKNT